jgi:hypothetical protein
VSEPPPNPLVISYQGLRKAVGIIGMALPVMVALGGLVLEWPPLFQPTISDYYYTVMRGWFVGSLCAIGVFMWSYNGYDRWDRWAGKSAFTFAILAALFPTAGEQVTPLARYIGYFHFFCASCLFVTLAVFCRLFRRSDQAQPRGRKLLRNRIYAVCEGTILASIGLIVLYGIFWRDTAVAALRPVFWLESLAVWAFGFSWLVKGEVKPFRDKPPPPPPL